MKTDLIQQFKLPSYIKGKSFADASKAIESKFKDRTDKYSNETKQELLERLSQAQEYLKTTMEASNNIEQNQAMFGMNLDEIGTQGSDMEGGVTNESPDVGAYLGAAQGALDLGNLAFGKTGIDTSGRTEAPDVNVAGTTIGSTLKGAQAGMAFGPLGAAVGGVLGLGAGLIGGNKAKKEAEKAETNYDLGQANRYRPNTYANGGILGPGPGDKEKGPIRNLTPEEQAKLDAKLKSQKVNEGTFSNYAAEYDPNNTGGIFANVDTLQSPSYPNLDLGKYKDVNYFNPSVSNDGRYTLNNTKNNPANADLYKQQLSYIQKLNPNANIAKYNDSGFKPLINQNAMGGYQKNKYANGGKPTIEQNQEGIYMDADKLGLNAAGFEAYQKANPMGMYEQPKTQAGQILGDTGNFLKDNYGSILRYAPLVGNLTNKIEKPITARPERLDNVYQPQLFDENRLINQVNQNNVNKALQEASGGNTGALRGNLLAANLNKTKALGDAYAQASNVNRDEERFKFQSGLQKDQFNAQLNESYIDRKARDEGAYNTAKSAQRSALFEDIGAIGKEESYKKLVKDMFGYKWNGKYFVDKDGKKVEKSTIDAKLKDKK